jgi:uncharacterized membrane protein YraQ (UPF0718 family)
VLPAAASIRKQGANKGATTAFLISTPESGVDSIAVTYALLDPLMTVIRPIAAFVTALLAGFAENILFWEKSEKEITVDRSCPVDGCCDGMDCPDEIHRKHHSIQEKLIAGIKFSYREVWGDIAVWFFIGVSIAGVITTFIPDLFMQKFMGGGFSSMLIMLVVGIPIYICATASTPVAAALILKGVSPGAALVFLLVGPATNITSLSVLLGILGKKSTVLYLTVLSLCAVAFGMAVDWGYQVLNIAPRAIIGEASELIPFQIKLVSALVVLAISLKPLKIYIAKFFSTKTNQTVFLSDFPTFPRKLEKVSTQPIKEEKPQSLHR